MEGPGWATGSKVICIPQDHGIILHFLINLCLINSLENLGCRFEVARIGFSVLVFCFLGFFSPFFLPRTLFYYFGGGGKGWCLSSPWKLSFWWIHRIIWAGEVLAYSENFIPILFTRATASVSDVLFMNLKPVSVTDPTGFVSPWFKNGCYILPGQMQFHRWWWDWAKSWRPGREPHICSDITRKICWWLAGLPESLIFNLISTL